MSEWHHTTSTYSTAQETANYVPWSKIRTLPPHLVHTRGPLAVPRLGEESNAPPKGKAPNGRPRKSMSEKPSGVLAEHIAPPKDKVLEFDRREALPDRAAETKTGSAAPAEEERPPELARIQSRVALWDSDERQAEAKARPVVTRPSFEPSDQLHVMGLDLRGRYIAHTLAGCQTIPPVRYMLHKHYLYKQWQTASGQLTLRRGDQSIAHRRVVGEHITGEDAEYHIGGLIDNLIVTLPASQVVKAIGHIRHRLDHRSTICLINDGLGVAEALIETYFPDESKRPMFLLGHFTASLDHTSSRFSVSEVRPGRLYLSLFSLQGRGAGQRFRIKRHPPVERTERGMHLVRLLSAIPGLNATGHSMPDFLRRKLSTVAFRTIVDPLAALLDRRYDALTTNAYARQLMDQLFGEVARVVSSLPECRDSPKLRQYVLSGAFRDDVFQKLMLQRTADSKMRAQVGRGWDTDIDFLSGYFVRRGRELQVPPTALDSLMWAVKAKQLLVLEDLASDIPFESTQPQKTAHYTKQEQTRLAWEESNLYT